MKFDKRVLDDKERGLFYGLLILSLLPLWLITYFPSQDGPIHLYNARIIGDWYRSDFSVFRDYFTLSERLDPTWFGHLILAALMKLFSPNISEKLFLTVYVVAFPLSIRYALGVVNPDARFLSVLAFPMVYNGLAHYGFYSFSMSLAVYCIFLGYWLRHAKMINLRAGVNVALITLLLYFTHVITMSVAYLSAAIISATWWVTEIIGRNGGKPLDYRSRGRTTWNLVIKPLIALLPGVVLVLLFMSDRERVFVPPAGSDLYERIKNFVDLGILYSFQRRELLLSGLLASVLWALSIWAIINDRAWRKLQRQDVLLLLAAVLTVSYLLAPSPGIVGESGTAGGFFIMQRLNLFPYLALLLWLGTREFSVVRKRFAQVAGVTISLAFLAVHIPHYVVINRHIDEYLSAIRLVEPGTTLLPVHASLRGLKSDTWIPSIPFFSTRRSIHAQSAQLMLGTACYKAFAGKVNPYRHILNRAGAERPILVLLNYQARLGYFPVRFRPSRNPYVHLGNMNGPPTKLGFASYMGTTGGRPDYVLIWLGRKCNVDDPDMQSIYSYLDRHYKRIFVSENELAELYQHRERAR